MADINYDTVVKWDSTLADVGYADADNGTLLKGLAINALKITTGAPTATVGQWLPGALVQNIVSGILYRNSGSTASPVWTVVTPGTANVVLAGALTGQTTATRAYTVTGLLATDIVTANIFASTNAVTIQKVTPSTDTLTVLFSGDPGAGTTVNYIAVR